MGDVETSEGVALTSERSQNLFVYSSRFLKGKLRYQMRIVTAEMSCESCFHVKVE